MKSNFSSELEPYAGPWGIYEIKHFLKRTMFGANPNDIQHFKNLSFQQTHNQILQISTGYIAPPINSYAEREADPNVPYGSTWVNAPFNSKYNIDRMWTTVYWWTNRLLRQDRTITEKMILFWHNHFGVALTGTNDSRSNYRYVNTLHKDALGNFKRLVKNVTIEPLMLNFLNGFQNQALAPDENYARELFELFTLGKGPESKYTEDDVKAAARVLTGFQYDYASGNADFFNVRHDVDDKVFSSFFKNRTIKTYGGNGDWSTEIFGMIDMIFENEEVSKFICRKLYRFFVNYDITEKIENNVILPLAAQLRNNNYEILPTVKTLLGSKHFFDSENFGSMIKSPLDFYIGLLREMEPSLPPDIRLYSYFMENLRKETLFLQQHLAEPPNVAGWPAYYQSPLYGRSWINSETLKLRAAILEKFLDINYKPRNSDIYINLLDYSSRIEGVENPDKLIDTILERLISQKPVAEYKSHLKKILLSNQDSDYYWTNAWQDYKNNPNDSNYKSIVEIRLKQFYKNIMHLDEYNLH